MGKTINLERRRCKGCRAIVPEERLSPSGKCRACSAPGEELAMAASLAEFAKKERSPPHESYDMFAPEGKPEPGYRASRC